MNTKKKELLLFTAERLEQLLTPGAENERLWKELPLTMQCVVLDAHMRGKNNTEQGIRAESVLINIFNTINPVIVFSDAPTSVNCRIRKDYVDPVRKAIQEYINSKN